MKQLNAMKQIAKSGRKILFVATKKQAKDIVAQLIKEINMPYVTERWSGGMLTNFPTIRKAVKKMTSIDKMSTDGTFDHLSKREKLQIQRQRAKLERTLGSIADLTRLPAAMFVVDIHKEKIAVAEAKKLGIPVFAIVDTNSNPNAVDYVIPANDDATKSISLIVGVVAKAINEGLEERKVEKDKEVKPDNKPAKKAAKPNVEGEAKKTSARKSSAKKPVAKKEVKAEAPEKAENKEAKAEKEVKEEK
jgi:small subunit ribosomal protein S2